MSDKLFLRTLIFCLLFTLFHIHLLAGNHSAQGHIHGVVKDSLSEEGLPFASVQLRMIGDSSIIRGTYSDSTGYYRFTDIPLGQYQVLASYMGYEEQVRQVWVEPRDQVCHFLLAPISHKIGDVIITAEKSLYEKTRDRTVVNVSSNKTLTGGSATDVLKTIPSVDIDIDGKITYRGSDRVTLLIDGQRSELIQTLDQIPADQIEKVELINNPSARFEAEGMSGIINIVLKSGKKRGNKTTLMLTAGVPETLGGNAGYYGTRQDLRVNVQGGLSHQTKFQVKDHIRENYQDSEALDYHQLDRQDENLNQAFLKTGLDQNLGSRQSWGISLMGTTQFNTADRTIEYESLFHDGELADQSTKELVIDLNNYALDGQIRHLYRFKDKSKLQTSGHISYLDRWQKMNNRLFSFPGATDPELQNTYSQQYNSEGEFLLDYHRTFPDSIPFETGYHFRIRDLLNDFRSESFSGSGGWQEDTEWTNAFHYRQIIHSGYVSLSARLIGLDIQAGLRGEYTLNRQDEALADDYLDFFPSLSVSKSFTSRWSVFAAYNRRINRPTIKMLNPYTDEYADVLNLHRGNPLLQPEYVHSAEAGTRVQGELGTVMTSVYFRDIDQAISRIKSAANDSALVVTFMNLDGARMIGGELAVSFRPVDWWSFHSSAHVFYTSLTGNFENNAIEKDKTAWNLTVSSQFTLFNRLVWQLSGNYRSKLPSVLGTYQPRYYMDGALSLNVWKKKGQIVAKVSDLFNTYSYGLDLDAVDADGFRYSQTNRRKNQSQYFTLSLIFNMDGKEAGQKQKQGQFFLDEFDK